MGKKSKLAKSIMKVGLTLAVSIIFGVIASVIIRGDIKTDNGKLIVLSAMFVAVVICFSISIFLDFYKSFEYDYEINSTEQRFMKSFLGICLTIVISIIISKVLGSIVSKILEINKKTDYGKLIDFFIFFLIITLCLSILKFFTYYQLLGNKRRVFT